MWGHTRPAPGDGPGSRGHCRCGRPAGAPCTSCSSLGPMGWHGPCQGSVFRPSLSRESSGSPPASTSARPGPASPPWTCRSLACSPCPGGPVQRTSCPRRPCLPTPELHLPSRPCGVRPREVSLPSGRESHGFFRDDPEALVCPRWGRAEVRTGRLWNRSPKRSGSDCAAASPSCTRRTLLAGIWAQAPPSVAPEDRASAEGLWGRARPHTQFQGPQSWTRPPGDGILGSVVPTQLR
ncbi:hypothetical protein HJG60_010411 [Phyllostomus discolor]|uniref:Uncharacterized protein n=1 Tax=Phyllostomus discolor TaxID=89673 RepID=A0A834EGK6_9CHIR|nr:hypothetical protein HJG60_010411 [Phyllostomus discolor]